MVTLFKNIALHIIDITWQLQHTYFNEKLTHYGLIYGSLERNFTFLPNSSREKNKIKI